MRIYLQTPGGPSGRPRFCQLSLQPDLLSGWNLVRETGYQGYGGQIQRTRYDNHEVAIEAMAKMRDGFVRRGYQTMFIEGQSAPVRGSH
jgi:predicted DNA-binding WGR domain protein